MDRESVYLMSVVQGEKRGVFGSVADVAGRVMLSCLVAWFMGVCLILFMRSPLRGTGGDTGQGPKAVSPRVVTQAASQSSPVFWPRYPTSYGGSSRAMEVNGVRFIVETARTWASPSAVLDYYTCQMAGRGWRDITEESHNMQPEVRHERAGDAGLQDQQFLEVYRKVKDTIRVFGNGVWTMHLYAEESAESKGQTMVMINAAAVPSLKDFADVWSSLGKSDNAGNKALDIVERHGGQRYHTRIKVRSGPPETAFAEELERLRRDSWRPSLVSAAVSGGHDRVAMLVRGGQYASLTATDTKDGKMASVTWTEVSPE